MRIIDASALTASEELAILDEFVDLETGIIRELLKPGVGFEDPSFHSCIAMPSHIWKTGSFVGQHDLTEGNAVGETESRAVLGAIGETLERYCLAFYRRNELVFTTYTDEQARGSRRLADPAVFALFAPDQRLAWGVPFTRESPVCWTEGISLVDRRSTWVPAQLVYLPYAPGPDEDYVFWSTSSGTAFGATVQSATLSGLCETIERDAFAIHWLNRLERPSLDLRADPALAAWYDELFGKHGNEICTYDITTDLGVPCFFSVLKGLPSRREPFMSVGAACHPNPERALKKAILEAFHTRRYGMNLMRLEELGGDRIDSIGSNRFHEHVLKYTSPVPLEEVAFCYAPTRTVPVTNALAKYRAPEGVDGALADCIARVHAAGYDPVAVNVTTDEIAEKGFFTVKTLVPGLHPLWAGADVPLGGTRIYEVPPALGFRPKTRSEMNLYPHPFP
jgi:ribosomal protein S12 methylthiotransferase accessory factor